MLNKKKLYFFVFYFYYSFNSSTKIEQGLDVVEKIGNLASSVGLEAGGVVSQGVDIAKDLVTIFKHQADPDQSLTLREKYYKNKITLERFFNSYCNINGIQNLKKEDFKYNYDEVKEILKSFGKTDEILRNEWKDYSNNELSYIAGVVSEALDKINQKINKIENNFILDNFEAALFAASNRALSKQKNLLEISNALDQSEKDSSVIEKNEKYLFNILLDANKIGLNENITYNTYNAILDESSFMQNKNQLYADIFLKLNQVLKNNATISNQNAIIIQENIKKIETPLPSKIIQKFDFLKESEKFFTQKTITNPEVAIPIYGWFRAIGDKNFRKKTITKNSVKSNLFAMNKYIVYGK